MTSIPQTAYGGFKKIMYGLPTFHFCLIMVICNAYLYLFCILQQYRSMSKRNPFVHYVFTCPYRFNLKGGCYCALSVKTFSDKDKILCRKLVFISFHLKLHTSHPSSGKRFRMSKFNVSFCRTVKHRSTYVKYGQRTWNSFTGVAKESRLVRLSPGLELLA